MKKYNINSILYSSFFSFFIMLIILLSYCFFPNISTLSKYIKYLSYIFSFIIFVVYLLNFKYSKFIFMLFGFASVILFSSYINTYGSTLEFFKIYFRIISLTCYLDYGLKKYTKPTLNSLFLVFYLLIVINFYTIIKYPNGLYTTDLYSSNWFFGYDNTHIFMYLPALILLFCTKKIFKPYGILLFLVITFSIFKCFSANSVVAYSIFLLYFIFNRSISKIEFLNIKSFFCTYIILFFLFVKFRIQNLFEWFIVGVLKKSLTFSTRTLIWDRVEKLIVEHPFLGYGQECNLTIVSKLGNPHYTHAHNTFLDVLYKCGLFGLIFHLLLIILPCKELYKYKDYFLAKILSVLLFSAMIMMIFEARQEKIGLYLILVFSYNIGNIITSFNHSEKFSFLKKEKI